MKERAFTALCLLPAFCVPRWDALRVVVTAGAGFRLGAHREAAACSAHADGLTCVAGGADVAGDGKNVNEIDMNIYADEYISSLRLSALELVKRDGDGAQRHVRDGVGRMKEESRAATCAPAQQEQGGAALVRSLHGRLGHCGPLLRIVLPAGSQGPVRRPGAAVSGHR